MTALTIQSAMARQAINSWHQWKAPGVLCTLDGQPMSASYVRVMLKRLAFKEGIDKHVPAHGFRHVHAAQLSAEGADIAIISQQLGHTNITTTARYHDHLAH